ncbi:MAG: hypothetical protein PUJ41_03250, partial [Bacteroidales bacterium]|nr:hypothetical protein [Bacteroidales bacterium]MDY4142886.1 hypothetical protein [Sodaliphilus sp.]
TSEVYQNCKFPFSGLYKKYSITIYTWFTECLLQTKGTVLLVCFQCVDTLVLVLKHAEGMSLRCDVICALAYCGRHESSHIVKAHADLALWEFLGSHRFNEIQQDDYLWKFVLICG